MDKALLELANLPLDEVFRLAFAHTGKPFPEVVKILGNSESHWRRVLSADAYFPRADTFPSICQKLGNSLIIDWQVAHLYLLSKQDKQAARDPHQIDARELPLRAHDLVVRLARVAEIVREVVADDVLSPAERKIVAKRISPLVGESLHLLTDLEGHNYAKPVCS